MSARGISTVASDKRPECHAPSGVRVNSYSDKKNARGVSPRDVQRAKILAFWESQGWARWEEVEVEVRDDEADNDEVVGQWFARDLISGSDKWLPLAGQGEDTRHDVIVFSHVIAAEADGAWCACNIVPEIGARNHNRATDAFPLTAEIESGLMEWRAFWFNNFARGESIKRLSPATLASITA